MLCEEELLPKTWRNCPKLSSDWWRVGVTQSEMAQLKNKVLGARGVPDTGKSNNKHLEDKDYNVN